MQISDEKSPVIDDCYNRVAISAMFAPSASEPACANDADDLAGAGHSEYENLAISAPVAPSPSLAMIAAV
jgi:hypothetical protein